MTILESLADAIVNQTTLAWCVEHAPDGDADRAIREAWGKEGSEWVALVDRWGRPLRYGSSLFDDEWKKQASLVRALYVIGMAAWPDDVVNTGTPFSREFFERFPIAPKFNELKVSR